jgi:uncharacterized protein YbjT (DUF2867 family)
MSKYTVLVTRATGSQGKAVCRHLQRNGFAIHALVRDASHERAIVLREFGATLFEGSLNDYDAITRAATGCKGLFLNLMPNLQQENAELEEAQTILAASKGAGIEHVVYNTSATVGNHEKVPNWNPNSVYGRALLSKHAIEEQVRQGDWEVWTILRPGYFMSNFLLPLGPWMFPELGSEKLFVSSFQPNTILPLIDTNDIGAFVVAAFSDPQRFDRQEIGIAGDAVSVPKVVESLSKAAGVPITARYRTEEETEVLVQTSPLVSGQVSSRSLDKFIDVETAKSWGVPFRTFDQFLANAQDTVEATFGS